MAIRQDNSTPITLPSIEQFNNRAAIRDFLLRQWIAENPQTKYRYFVETLSSRLRIYLERPGRLNKGCDFVIYTENSYQWKNGNDRPPDHNFILEDLTQKKNQLTVAQWNNFLLAVFEIHNSNLFANTIQYTSGLPLIGHNYELSLKLIRWFFIEQDVTYWSGRGRDMFYDAIQSV